MIQGNDSKTPFNETHNLSLIKMNGGLGRIINDFKNDFYKFIKFESFSAMTDTVVIPLDYFESFKDAKATFVMMNYSYINNVLQSENAIIKNKRVREATKNEKSATCK